MAAVVDGQARRWSINQLATELKVARRVLGRVLENVQPAAVERGSPRYWLSDVVEALIVARVGETASGTVVDLDRARERRVTALAELAEVQLRERSGELLSRDAVIEVWADGFTAIKNRMRGTPRRLVSRGVISAEQGRTLLAELDAGLNDVCDGFAGVPKTPHKRAHRAAPAPESSEPTNGAPGSNGAAS